MLVLYFNKKPVKAISWINKKLNIKYGNICDELGYDKIKRKEAYDLFSKHSHPYFEGNLFFEWDTNKPGNFTVNVSNEFNEFYFYHAFFVTCTLITFFIQQQFRTFNINKTTMMELVRRMHDDKDPI